MVLTDAEGRIALANPAAESMFGFEAEKSIGKPLIQVITEYQVYELLKKCLLSASEQTTEVGSMAGEFLRVISGASHDLHLSSPAHELRRRANIRCRWERIGAA
ncbi:MAG: PAS domain-containing protein [Chloroflexi bacterium]|nr:PAS domain-containing protein [Chloroflexota bacterium]